jgi:hypothetical protein
VRPFSFLVDTLSFFYRRKEGKERQEEEELLGVGRQGRLAIAFPLCSRFFSFVPLPTFPWEEKEPRI